MTNEEERLTRLRRTLHSLATRVPKIILRRVDWTFPVLKDKASVKLNATSTEVPHCSKDANAKQLLGEDSGELYSCQICKNSFSRRNILSGHTSATTRETTSYCEMCVKSLSDNRNAVQRLRSRERPFSCNICNKGFTSRSVLDKHMRVHTGERPFSCEICKKSFGHRCNLITHLKVHSGERSFSCEVCKKTFVRSSHVKGHVRLHSGERPYSCEVCKKRFTQRSNLNTHLKVHSGERPFSCKICNKTFSHSSALKRHMRVHSGERPFSCHLCKKGFTRRYVLNTHLRFHSEA